MTELSPELKDTYDLIVVGAGTAGCSAAITAAQKGLSVCIVDYKEEKDIGDKVCGDLMGEPIIRFIKENLGLDYSDIITNKLKNLDYSNIIINELKNLDYSDIITNELKNLDYFNIILDELKNLDYSDIITNKLNHMDVYSPDGTVISMPSDGVMIDRLRFGQALLADAIKENCDLKYSYRCKGPVIEDGYVCGVKIKDEKTGSVSTLRSKIVVDASGAGGILRKELCDNKFFDSSFIERDIDPEDRSCSYRQIIKLENPLDNTDTGKMHLQPESGGYSWVFPEDEKTVNVGIGVACNNKKKKLKERLEAIMAEDEIFNGSELIEEGSGVVPTRRSFYSPVGKGIMFVGDAGSGVNPLTGGGIGSSIGAGFMAATIAAKAIKNKDVSQEGLWGYNTWYHDPNNELRKEYGAGLFDGGIQAGRDIIRIFVQSLKNKQVDWIFKNYIDNSIFSDMVSADSGILTPKRKAEILIRGIRNPILLRVGEVISLMKEMNEVYENYPQTPDMFPDWRKEVESIDAKLNDLSTQSSWSMWLNLFSKTFY